MRALYVGGLVRLWARIGNVGELQLRFASAGRFGKVVGTDRRPGSRDGKTARIGIVGELPATAPQREGLVRLWVPIGDRER